MRMSGLVSLSVLMLGFAVSSAHAGVINVDFNYLPSATPTYSGQGVISAPGNFWNAIQGNIPGAAVSIGSLLDSEGNSTSIGMQLPNVSGHFVLPPTPAGPATSENALLSDYFYVNGSNAVSPPITMTLNGLTPGATFDLAIYNGQTLGADTYTLHSSNGGASAIINSTQNQSFVDGVTYAILSGTANLSGEILVTVNAGEANMSGFQLSVGSAAVPEPSSFALLGVGALGAIYYRRRKQKRVFDAKTLP